MFEASVCFCSFLRRGRRKEIRWDGKEGEDGAGRSFHGRGRRGMRVNVAGEHCCNGFVALESWAQYLIIMLSIALGVWTGESCCGFVVQRTRGEKGWKWKRKVARRVLRAIS